jgi:hypothetical protein
MYSLNPAQRIADAHMGQLSAFVYRDKVDRAACAWEVVRLYGPLASVKTAEQLLMAAISPVGGMYIRARVVERRKAS